MLAALTLEGQEVGHMHCPGIGTPHALPRTQPIIHQHIHPTNFHAPAFLQVILPRAPPRTSADRLQKHIETALEAAGALPSED